MHSRNNKTNKHFCSTSEWLQLRTRGQKIKLWTDCVCCNYQWNYSYMYYHKDLYKSVLKICLISAITYPCAVVWHKTTCAMRSLSLTLYMCKSAICKHISWWIMHILFTCGRRGGLPHFEFFKKEIFLTTCIQVMWLLLLIKSSLHVLCTRK